MTALDVVAALLMIAGGVFFTAGTIGVLRFGDLLSRLHALTKADNVGLGLLVLGLMIQVGSVTSAAKLALVWLFAVFSAAVGARLLAAGAEARETTGHDRPAGDSP